MAKKTALGLGAALNTAAGKKKAGPALVSKPSPETVLIGAHFSPVVQRALRKVLTLDHAPRNMRALLGEAINDVCAKYHVTEPYREEA
jgi:antitoxin-like ribbon-helix-helix protein